MYSIGEFSKITGLTIKTLRFYHERGLMIPARVEVGSGYRFYDQRNVDTARAITALREFEFSLEEIAKILQDYPDDADIVSFLQQRKESLQQSIARERDLVAALNRIIQRETEAQEMTQKQNYRVEEKQLPAMLVAGIRMTGRYDECGKAFAKLGRNVGRHICGPPMCLMYNDEYREEDADFEPCMPVKEMLQLDGIDVRQLPEQRCLSLIHRGPYDDLGRSYEKLIRFAKQMQLTLSLPSREVYLKGPGMIFKGNPQKYLTEIQIPYASDASSE